MTATHPVEAPGTEIRSAASMPATWPIETPGIRRLATQPVVAPGVRMVTQMVALSMPGAVFTKPPIFLLKEGEKSPLVR